MTALIIKQAMSRLMMLIMTVNFTKSLASIPKMLAEDAPMTLQIPILDRASGRMGGKCKRS